MLHNYLAGTKVLKPLTVKLLLFSCLDRYKLLCTFTFCFTLHLILVGDQNHQGSPPDVTGAVQRSSPGASSEEEAPHRMRDVVAVGIALLCTRARAAPGTG